MPIGQPPASSLPPSLQITDAERILIRALASAAEMQASAEHLSSRDGAEEDFDPARQAHFALKAESLHTGLASESLIDALLHAPADTADAMQLPLPESERSLLAAILLQEEEELSAERLEGAVRALRRMQYRRRLELIQRELQASANREPARLQTLLEEKLRLKRALMDPGVPDAPNAPSP